MSDCSTKAYAMPDSTAWLKAHRCPTCKNKKQPACVYKVREKIGGGFKCSGYRCDVERMWREWTA